MNLNDNIIGNQVRVKTSPNYYRVERSTNTSQYYQLKITYLVDPSTTDEEVRESHFDPFPDNFSEFAQTENYRTSLVVREYYISPQSSEDIPVKKLETITLTPTHAYVSVAGTAMQFNITLLACATDNCTIERELAVVENAAILGINLNAGGDSIGGTGRTGADVSVFVGITAGIVMSGMCTAGLLFGAKKLTEGPEEEPLTKN